MGIWHLGKFALGAALGILVLSTGFFSVSLQAAGATCESYSSRYLNKNVQYCVQRSRPELPSLEGEPVVYFFHGIGGSAKSLMENGYSEALQILGDEENFPPFTVVSFDTAAMSFFSDRAGRSVGSSAYESWFIKEFMPFIEGKHRLCRQRDCRGTMGLSMGGFGALKIALRFSNLFSFAAVNSPALVPYNVWDNGLRWGSYFARHPIGNLKGQLLLREVRNIFTNRELFDWNNPIWLVSQFGSDALFPHIYIDVGGQDYFGFQEGFFLFTDELKRKGASFISDYNPNGSHDQFWDRRWWLLRYVRDQLAEPRS